MLTVLEQLFHDCFYASHRTRLQGGAPEPLYLPSSDGADAVIYYREDHAASLLHEVAHWCIAGEARRQQEDYGYWYAPDGRDAGQQAAFEKVEVRPQAIEWHFALAAKMDFRVSADNLAAAPGTSASFEHAVLNMARHYCANPLPGRAARYRDTLAKHLGAATLPGASEFILAAGS